MKGRKAPAWTDEELALLKTSMQTLTLSRHPLMVQNQRTYKAIATRRSIMHKEATRAEKEENLAYDGRPVQPYQPIKIAEATPERIKQWGRLNREEIRAMHRERELGYPI